jgi:uncharacterized repeat protein (TIGR01451 family)
MKRLILRIGALVMIVVLGVIAYAYGQRGTDDAAGADNTAPVSPLRVGNMQSVFQTNPDVNPLRSKEVTSEKQSESISAIGGRATRISADSAVANSGAPRPLADPFGLSSHQDGMINDRSVRQAASNDSIPDAAELEAQETNNNPNQSRHPQLVGPNLGSPSSADETPLHQDAGSNLNASSSELNPASPPMVQRYPAKENSTDRYSSAGKTGDRYRNQAAYQNQNNSDNQEPGRFRADPSSAPTAIAQTADPAQDHVFGSRGKAAAESCITTEGTARPGSKQLDGPQTPQVTIQKFAPPEIQVGKPAVFKITVRNTGSISANQVEIHDQVPKGTSLLGTTPRATQGARGEIVWTLGALRPGEESSVEMELLPTAEGEIGSVATVHIGAEASARTISTRPQLVVQTSAPGKVLIGEQMTLEITISNPGTGVATGVVLEEHIPQGLQHPAGAELEYDVGDLRPGETKRLELPLAAVAAGSVQNLLLARADGNLSTEDRLEFEVVAPKLDIAMEGPKRRYLEREATYQLSVSNPGTAAAQQVELAAYLPPGLKFVSANNSGHYDEVNRAVYWRLEELPSNETGAVELVTMPVEAGRHNIKLRGTAQRGLEVEKEQPVIVEGIAAILFQAADLADPLEVGGETTYEVHVVNQGSKASTNVRLAVLLPGELQAVAAEGPTRYSIEGNRVVFEGLAQLAPKADTTYRVRVKGLRPGDLRTRFQLITDDMQSPVTKEESTRVYSDE